MTGPVPSRGPQILGVSISLVIVSGIIVGARILARKSSTAGNRTNSDDWLIYIAWGFALARSITDSLSVLIYGYGRHSTDISVGDSHKAVLLSWISGLFYRFSALTIKLSVLFLYLRLFAPHGLNPHFRRLVLFTIYAILLIFGAFIILGIFGCWPVDTYWIKGKKGRCINFLPFYYTYTAMEVLFDFWVMLLPVRVIGGLGLPRKTKWGLVVLFGLGLLSTAANIPVLQSLSGASQQADMSWTAADAKTWTSLKLNLSIICTCLPVLRNPIQTLARRIFGVTVINTNNIAIPSRHHRLGLWEEAGDSNEAIGSSINRTLQVDLDNVAVTDFAGSRDGERVEQSTQSEE